MLSLIGFAALSSESILSKAPVFGILHHRILLQFGLKAKTFHSTVLQQNMGHTLLLREVGSCLSISRRLGEESTWRIADALREEESLGRSRTCWVLDHPHVRLLAPFMSRSK